MYRFKPCERMLQFDFEFIIPGPEPASGRDSIQKQLDCFIELKRIIIEGIKKDIKEEDLIIPDYLPADEWVLKSTIKHWMNFYKK